MRLQTLSGLERKKIEDELAEILLIIANLKDILARSDRVDEIIKNELIEVKEKFGDVRKTEVNFGGVGEFNPRDTIPNEDVVITLSKNQYLKRVKANSFRTQRR